jgi:hypothetical protein
LSALKILIIRQIFAVILAHGFIERDAENSFLAELNDSEARDDQSYSVCIGFLYVIKKAGNYLR